MTPEVATRLMEAVASDRLVILCGAGLSMAAPSAAPSAAAVARHCAEEYLRSVGTAIDAEISGDIERLAKWFGDSHRFDTLFINTLVPWSKFNTSPNAGHEAIADFLACGIVCSGVTTNYDRLIEDAASLLGEPDFQAIVDVSDLGRTFPHKPLLKVHGCCAVGQTRLATIWYREQLSDGGTLQVRADRFRTWLESSLLDRDVLIIGFWTDWEYLTDVFSTAIAASGPRSVIVVDPSSAADLEGKAPQMWAWAHQEGMHFFHEQESGADFLHAFRTYYSKVFLNQLFMSAVATHTGLFGEVVTPSSALLDGISDNDLYALRRDLTATPRNAPVRNRNAEARFNVHTAVHLRLLTQGAIYRDHTYELNGGSIRVINGAGQLMSQVKATYELEPPVAIHPDRIFCIGAVADPSPGNVVRPEERATILRPGSEGEWLPERDLLRDLGAAI